MIRIVPAAYPYKPEIGDLVCDFIRMEETDPKPSDYLESKPPVKRGSLSHRQLAHEFKDDNEALLKYLKSHKLNASVDLSKQILALQMLHPNPWTALKCLHIDAEGIKSATYECPYTGYTHYSIVPVALISDNLAGKYADVDHWNKEYLFDHEFARHLWKEKVLEIGVIAKMLLGSGWTSGTHITDGSRGEIATTVALDNGDKLLVQTWEWYNK
jgi:hypothetical protein